MLCSEKFKHLSIVTPNSFSFSVFTMLLFLMLKSDVVLQSCFPIVITWYLLRFPSNRLDSYHSDVAVASRLTVFSAISG